MKPILITVIIALVALTVTASIASSCATQRQAQATIEVARAAQIASAGQAVATTALVVLLGLVILAACAICGLLYLRARGLQRQLAVESNWQPGGGRRVNGQYLPGGGHYASQLQQPDPIQAMLTLMVMQQIQQQPRQPQALPQNVDDQWRW